MLLLKCVKDNCRSNKWSCRVSGSNIYYSALRLTESRVEKNNDFFLIKQIGFKNCLSRLIKKNLNLVYRYLYRCLNL